MDDHDDSANRKRKRPHDQNEEQRPARKPRNERGLEESQTSGSAGKIERPKQGAVTEVNSVDAGTLDKERIHRGARPNHRQGGENRTRTAGPEASRDDEMDVDKKEMQTETKKSTAGAASISIKTSDHVEKQTVGGSVETFQEPMTGPADVEKDTDKAAHKAARNAARKARRQEERMKSSQGKNQVSAGTNTTIEVISQSKSSRGRNRQQEEGDNVSVTTKKVKSKTTQSGQASKKPLKWTISEPVGGKFLNINPIFSADEKHIVFGTEYTINVYSTASSLLVRSFSPGSSGRITAFTMSASNSEILYVGTDKGHVLKLNIIDGKRVGRWSIATKILAIHASVVKANGEDILYILDKSRSWGLTVHRFGIDGDPSKTDLSVLVNLNTPIRDLKVMEQGKVVIAMTSEGLLIGNAAKIPDDDLRHLKYQWEEVKCPEAPSCFAVQVMPSVQSSVTKLQSRTTTRTTIPSVNVAIGGTKGCLYVYHDVVNGIGNPPKTMHWHREAIGAVAWSLDGNYLISGGRETVLVLWQLDTGRKQFLPNLEAPIHSLVVSPSGSSYAVRLGDNSVMVLSTSELTPTTNIVGLQTLAFTPSSKVTTLPQTVESLVTHGKDALMEHTACVISPHSSSHLIVAVPAYQPETDIATEMAVAPYIQTFDYTNSRHVTRQAITRTNATSTNLGPEGNRIVEPDVKLMQVSSNGRWLVTVDEWSTPNQDMADLTVESQDPNDGVKKSKDIHLKFWAWNTEREEWMLNSRIAQPHQKEGYMGSETIFDLAVDPSSTRFATLGADFIVRIWTPKSKTPTGKVVRGERKSRLPVTAGQVDTWWSLEYTVSLQAAAEPDAFEAVDALRGKLAFSNDGSTLAAYVRPAVETESVRSMVHFIDVDRGLIQSSRTRFCPQGEDIHDLGFLDRYLICVGHQTALVWDTTSYTLHFETTFRPTQSSTDTSSFDFSKTPSSLLAINIPSSTFAIAVPQAAPRAKSSQVNPLLNYSTKISIFSIMSNEKPLFECAIPRVALAMLSASTVETVAEQTEDSLTGTANRKGYVVLDAAAEIRVIQLGASTIHGKKLNYSIEAPSSIAPLENAGILASIQPVEGEDDRETKGDEILDVAALFAKQEDDRPVVRTQQLANVFDYPSHAMPPMMDMFRSVVGLYAGKA